MGEEEGGGTSAGEEAAAKWNAAIKETESPFLHAWNDGRDEPARRIFVLHDAPEHALTTPRARRCLRTLLAPHTCLR